MIQIEWLIAGINPKARHFVNFVTAANIFLPVRPGQVDAAKRSQKARSVLPAFSRQPRVDPIHIFREQRLETPGPSLDDPMLLELRDQSFRVAILQGAKWPVEQIYVGVDDPGRLAGSGNRSFAGRRLCRQRWAAGEGNSGRAQQRTLQKPATIDGLHQLNASRLANQSSIFILFLRKMGAQILRRFPPKIFIRSAFEISASKTLP